MRLLPVVLGFFLTASVARPCSFTCPDVPICRLVGQAEAIVIAETVELGEPVRENQVRAKMRVVRRLKSSPAIGETFEKIVSASREFVGRQWLVSFTRDSETGEIGQAGECMDEPVDYGLRAHKLSFLEQWAAQSPSSPTLLGIRTRYDGVTVTAEGDAGRFERVSQGGLAAFWGIPPGSYAVTASGDGFEPDRFLGRTQVVVAQDGCMGRSVTVRPTQRTRVSGAVLGPDGTALTGMPVSLVEYDPNGVSVAPRSRKTTTSRGGRFVFEGEHPGRYWLAVNAGLGPARPYPTVFLPGVPDLRDATAIDLDVGEVVENLTVQFPTRLRERRVRVRVLWSDGSPAADARIENVAAGAFRSPFEYYRYAKSFSTAPTNEQGWTEIKIYESLRYRLKAVTPTPHQALGLSIRRSAESLPLEIEPGDEPLELEARLRRYEYGGCSAKHFLE